MNSIARPTVEIHNCINQKSKPRSSWIGCSPALKTLENTITRVSKFNYPILIKGEAGTGKQLVVWDLWEKWGYTYKDIIEFDCLYWYGNNFEEVTKQLFQLSDIAIIYFRQIELLSNKELQVLQRYLRSIDRIRPRLVASTRYTLSIFSHSKLASFESLSMTITLPTLAERNNDILPLIDHANTRSGSQPKIYFSKNEMNKLCTNKWPGNVRELWCFIEKTKIEKDLNTQESIIKSLTAHQNPHSAYTENAKLNIQNATHASLSKDVIESNSKNVIKLGARNMQQKESAVEGRYVKNLPVSIQRASKYIADNYQSNISISDVANYACISAPHLSYLLKKYIGRSYKQILIGLRIDEARRLLIAHPKMNVTKICDEIGYTDLSNFEKAFKKLEGKTPGQYRRTMLQDRNVEPEHVHKQIYK